MGKSSLESYLLKLNLVYLESFYYYMSKSNYSCSYQLDTALLKLSRVCKSEVANHIIKRLQKNS